ncbi:MAG: hypothetical protein HZA90_22775 [Verrucomicrobia bacterium]|nr:hypothetical protein [Verrucomicrobiota bacterium]
MKAVCSSSGVGRNLPEPPCRRQGASRPACVRNKTASFHRSDRLAKHNQLLRIEQLLGEKVVDAGTSALPKGRQCVPMAVPRCRY